MLIMQLQSYRELLIISRLYFFYFNTAIVLVKHKMKRDFAMNDLHPLLTYIVVTYVVVIY